MPCNSYYLEPTRRENELRRAARLLLYTLTARSKDVPTFVRESASSIYGGTEDVVPMLCAECKDMSDAEREHIIYNARNKSARDLANWWEEHQAADAKREAEERRVRERADIARGALSKLSAEERKALGFADGGGV